MTDSDIDYREGKAIRRGGRKFRIFLCSRNYIKCHFLLVIGMFIVLATSTVAAVLLGGIWALLPSFMGILLGFALITWYMDVTAYREKLYELRGILRTLRDHVAKVALESTGANSDIIEKIIVESFSSANYEIQTIIDEIAKLGVSKADLQRELGEKYQNILNAVTEVNIGVDQKVEDILNSRPAHVVEPIPTEKNDEG